MTGRDPGLDQKIEAVRRLLEETSGRLSAQRIREVDELLRNDEPQEAVLGIAWDLAPLRDELPEHIVRLIRLQAGSLLGVPPAFQE